MMGFYPYEPSTSSDPDMVLGWMHLSRSNGWSPEVIVSEHKRQAATFDESGMPEHAKAIRIALQQFCKELGK